MTFSRLDSETAWKGHVLEVRIEHFRHDDGGEVKREVIGHPGAVGIVAYDDAQVWLVRQPREAAPQAGEAADGAQPGTHPPRDASGLERPDLALRRGGPNRLQRLLKIRCIVQ